MRGFTPPDDNFIQPQDGGTQPMEDYRLPGGAGTTNDRPTYYDRGHSPYPPIWNVAPPPPPGGRRRRGPRILWIGLAALAALAALLIIVPKHSGPQASAGDAVTPTATTVPPTATPTATATPIPVFSANLTYNTNVISDDASPGAVNLDGFGDSYSAQALSAAGLHPGATIPYNGINFVWPGQTSGGNNSMRMKGQSVNLQAAIPYTTLGFLGSSHFGGSQVEITIVYSDGSQQKAKLGFSDWSPIFGGDPQYGNSIVVTMPYHNSIGGKTQLNTYVYYAEIALTPGKIPASIKFPDDNGQIDLFSIGAK